MRVALRGVPPRSREGHIDAIVARLGKRNPLAVPRSSLSAGLQLAVISVVISVVVMISVVAR